MLELRLRNKVSAEELETKVGRILTDSDYNLRLTGPALLRKPEGEVLCAYLPGAVLAEMSAAYPILTTIRGKTDNRGLAAGSPRVRGNGFHRTRSKKVTSTILGAYDHHSGGRDFCRLTAFSANEVAKWVELRPLFQTVARLLETTVAARYAAQAQYAQTAHPDWVIPGTPFTTITVNNTYPTGVHTDKGDLDEGFSTLSVARRGPYTGGYLTFPEYRVAVDMQDGDLLLMDAHDWHGNTALVCKCGTRLSNACEECGAERISVVSYFRTQIAECGSLPEEDAKRTVYSEQTWEREIRDRSLYNPKTKQYEQPEETV